MTFTSKLIGFTHRATGCGLLEDKPKHWQQAIFAMGCFWGAEKRFWQLDGVKCTAVGYTAGGQPNPTYEQVCTGSTGHAEAVMVWFDPAEISYLDLLATFWQEHDPTQGMRQGNDRGSQYRSGVYTFNSEQAVAAKASKHVFEQALKGIGKGAITTEIVAATVFYYAEPEHQQYLMVNPFGYCGLQGTGLMLDQSRVMGALKS